MRPTSNRVLVLVATTLLACAETAPSTETSGPGSPSPDPVGNGGAAPSPSPSPSTSPSPAPPGETSGPPPSGEGSSTPPPGFVAGLVGVGYGGLRVTSRDGGKTWKGTAAATGGGDDENLLRAVAYASGLWLAVGWQATTSKDGLTWTPLAKINAAGGVTWNGAPTCGLVEGLTSDGTYFYAACAAYAQAHKAYRSQDGVTWTELGTIGELGGHPALARRGGTFYAYGDNGTSFRSTNGSAWSAVPGLTQATYCEGQWKSRAGCFDASWFGGFYFRSVWQSKVTRSPNGASFGLVHDDASNNTLYQPRAIAEGMVKL